MRIGVYVGSFNPVHIGHISIINHLIDKKYVDKVIVIPTMNYWDKTNLIDIQDRINMLKLYETDKIIVNETLNNYEYTYQILNELKKIYNNLFLIIGADNLPKFNLWKNVNEILKHHVLVLNRDNINVNIYINKFTEKDKFIIVNDMKNIDISSTKIRNDIENNKHLLDKFIYNYIKNNNLSFH